MLILKTYQFAFGFGRTVLNNHWHLQLPFLTITFSPKRVPDAMRYLQLLQESHDHDERVRMLSNRWLVTHSMNSFGARLGLMGYEAALFEELCTRVYPDWHKDQENPAIAGEVTH